MSLIRNGGFERGNTNFWEVISGGTLEVSNVSPLYGTYCGKFVSSGADQEIILSNDYIPVALYQIVNTGLWVKSTDLKDVYPILYTYDADYSFIEKIYGTQKTMDGTYQAINTQFTVPAGCTYIRFGCEISYSAVDEEYYLDSGILDTFTKDNSINGVTELLPLTDYHSSDSTELDGKDMKQFSTYYAQLQCSYVTGTSPTLDVAIYELDAFSGEILLGTFTQVIAASNERIDLPRCQGNQMYIRYTIGGTNPVFYFGVAVVGKG